MVLHIVFFFQAEDGIRDGHVTGVQTCALPISGGARPGRSDPGRSRGGRPRGRDEPVSHAAARPAPDPALTRRARALRGAELAMIVLAVVLAVTAYVLAGMGRDDHAPPSVVAYGALFAVGYVAAHVAVRRLAPAADPVFLPTAGLLAGLGFAMIFRLDPDLATSQAGWLALGLAAFLLTLLVVRDHRTLDQFTYTIGLIGIVLLLLPIVPGLGRTINGARLWIRLGPLTFQPAEAGKLFVV